MAVLPVGVNTKQQLFPSESYEAIEWVTKHLESMSEAAAVPSLRDDCCVVSAKFEAHQIKVELKSTLQVLL